MQSQHSAITPPPPSPLPALAARRHPSTPPPAGQTPNSPPAPCIAAKPPPPRTQQGSTRSRSRSPNLLTRPRRPASLQNLPPYPAGKPRNCRTPPYRSGSSHPLPPTPRSHLPACPANSPTLRLPNKSTCQQFGKLASAPPLDLPHPATQQPGARPLCIRCARRHPVSDLTIRP